MTTPAASPAPVPTTKPATHGCVRCGAPVPLDVGLCERCNPLGLKDSSASQVHGTVFVAVVGAIVGLALVARLVVSGVGPFSATVTDSASRPDGLAVTLTVTNHGTAAGQTTCQVTDPKDRNGLPGAILVSPRIAPGAALTFTETVSGLGTVSRELRVDCKTP